jgi:hypothetical protein
MPAEDALEMLFARRREQPQRKAGHTTAPIISRSVPIRACIQEGVGTIFPKTGDRRPRRRRPHAALRLRPLRRRLLHNPAGRRPCIGRGRRFWRRKRVAGCLLYENQRLKLADLAVSDDTDPANFASQWFQLILAQR